MQIPHRGLQALVPHAQPAAVKQAGDDVRRIAGSVTDGQQQRAGFVDGGRMAQVRRPGLETPLAASMGLELPTSIRYRW